MKTKPKYLLIRNPCDLIASPNGFYQWTVCKLDGNDLTAPVAVFQDIETAKQFVTDLTYRHFGEI